MNKNTKTMYRQGDVLIEQISSLPNNLVKNKRDNNRVILAYGEVTNHSHAIFDEEVNHFFSPNEKTEPGLVGITYLEVRAALVALKHEEHSTIELPNGNYRVIRQCEYSPTAIRSVAD